MGTCTHATCCGAAVRNITMLRQAADILDSELLSNIPQSFLPGYKSPCWDANQTASDKHSSDTGLRCLPYAYISGFSNGAGGQAARQTCCVACEPFNRTLWSITKHSLHDVRVCSVPDIQAISTSQCGEGLRGLGCVGTQLGLLVGVQVSTAKTQRISQHSMKPGCHISVAQLIANHKLSQPPDRLACHSRAISCAYRSCNAAQNMLIIFFQYLCNSTSFT